MSFSYKHVYKPITNRFKERWHVWLNENTKDLFEIKGMKVKLLYNSTKTTMFDAIDSFCIMHTCVIWNLYRISTCTLLYK